MRPRAFCLIRGERHYRRDAFEAGLKGGFSLEGDQHIGTIRPSDLLICWNRYGRADVLAERFEAAGAPVIICENGLIGASENAFAKQFARIDQDPASHLYMLSLNFHNGAGRWPIGEPGRWRGQGIALRPWRTTGEHVLVACQRGFGHPRVAPPKDWLERTMARLKALTKRPIKVRSHPGNTPAAVPLVTDLDGAWACVVWGSGAGVKALAAGVPVCSDFREWVCAPAALPLTEIENPLCSDEAREAAFHRLSWLQWQVHEIATGEPIKRLLELHQTQRQAA